MLVRLACTLLAHQRIAPTKFIAADARLPCSIDVIPYPFDFDEVDKLTPRSPDAQTPTFCYVGRITPEKGPDLLLQAAKLLTDRGVLVRIRLVGHGPQMPSLQQEARHLGLEDRYVALGKLPRVEALREMAGSLAVVVPSRWDDPSPFTVLEAAALGRPVIGSDRGGTPEIVGPGLVFRSESAPELADHMERLVTKPGEADRIGKACREFTLLRSDPVSIGKALERIYRTGRSFPVFNSSF